MYGGTPGPRAQQGSSPAGSSMALWLKGIGARFLIEIMRVRIAPGLPVSLRDRLNGRTAGFEPDYRVTDLRTLGRGEIEHAVPLNAAACYRPRCGTPGREGLTRGSEQQGSNPSPSTNLRTGEWGKRLTHRIVTPALLVRVQAT